MIAPPPEAIENARSALALRKTLPKSRRGGLEPEEAERQGIRSGVVYATMLAQGSPCEPREYLRTLKRFRGMAYRAMAQDKGPENSKAIQVFMMWGGDAMIEACEKAIQQE
jgi:hypothetical protein